MLDWILFFLLFFFVCYYLKEFWNLRSATSVLCFTTCWIGSQELRISLLICLFIFCLWNEFSFFFLIFGLISVSVIPVNLMLLYQQLHTCSFCRFICFGLDTLFSLPLMLPDFWGERLRVEDCSCSLFDFLFYVTVSAAPQFLTVMQII